MTDDVKCPICGSGTTLRTAKNGNDVGKSFHVCNRYPECKGKVPIIAWEPANPSMSDNDKFYRVFDMFRNRCNTVVTTYEENKYYKSFYWGGGMAALGVVTTCTDLKKLWGEGSIEMAKSLSELFALEMISIWSRQNAENARDSNEVLTQDAIDKYTKSLATAILNICDDYSEETIRYFMNMDKQLNYDRDKGKLGFFRSSLLLARAHEVCGQDCIDWNKLTLPVESAAQSVNAIKHHPNPDDVVQMGMCVANGCQAMYKVQQM